MENNTIDLSNGDERQIVSLKLNEKSIRATLMLAILALCVGLMELLIGLVLFFRPLMFEWGKSGTMFYFWIVLSIVTIALALMLFIAWQVAKKKGGLVLTNKRVYGVGGFFLNKKFSFLIEEINDFTITRLRNQSYLIKINGIKCFLLQSPFDFEKELRNRMAQKSIEESKNNNA